jgi:predicted adenine nucleotide alpha hydrolase (AANH) superfamily ATPase
MLVHICCSVDSHFFLQKLQKEFPAEKLTAFFYDPNIHPYSEYRLRLLDVQRSCRLLNIDLIEGSYDLERWLNAVKGLENEPEKGARCMVCFGERLDAAAQKAVQIDEKSFTTTLLVSPKKRFEQLRKTGEEIAKNTGWNLSRRTTAKTPVHRSRILWQNPRNSTVKTTAGAFMPSLCREVHSINLPRNFSLLSQDRFCQVP